jgi:hypothetical protein
VTVATVPAAPPWQAHTCQWLGSICCPATDAPVTVMSKSAIVTRKPVGLRGTSLPPPSRTVSRTAPQKPTGSGFNVGVTVTIHGSRFGTATCARDIDGRLAIAAAMTTSVTTHPRLALISGLSLDRLEP